MRLIGGILVGLIAGVLALMAISYLGDLLFPMTTEVDANDPEQVTGAFSSAPLGAKLALLAALFGGAVVGGLVARRIAQLAAAAWPVAILFTLFGIAIIFFVTLPTWMQIALVIAPLLGGFIAGHGRARRAAVEREAGADATV